MFLETICINNGIVQHIEAHKERMRKTAAHFGFHAPELPDLSSQLPDELKDKKVKCSITYHENITNIVFSEYVARKIRSLKLVESDVNYRFKFSDRAALNNLLQQKENADEILIVQNNCIADTTFSNVVFQRNNTFFTPDTYLLNGTKRQKLLQEKKIEETRITVDDLSTFDAVFLVNAMLDIEDQKGISISNIKPM